jgi:hypothetical protein
MKIELALHSFEPLCASYKNALLSILLSLLCLCVWPLAVTACDLIVVGPGAG